jgi:hypothetical protein
MSDAAIGGEVTVRYTRGALYGLAAVSIWSGTSHALASGRA